MCGSAGFDRWRSQTVEGLAGRVVEIGWFGSGLNVPHYQPDVDVVLAVEPAMVARRIAERRTAASPARVEHVGVDGQRARYLTLRATRPSSRSLCAPCPIRSRRSQNCAGWCGREARSTFWNTGCLPTRVSPRGSAGSNRRSGGLPTDATSPGTLPRLVERAGFVMERNEQRNVRGPKPWCWITLGVATKPLA